MSEHVALLLGEIRSWLRCSVCPEDQIPIERIREREQTLALHDELLDLLLRPPHGHLGAVRRLLEAAHREDMARRGVFASWDHALRWRRRFS